MQHLLQQEQQQWQSKQLTGIFEYNYRRVLSLFDCNRLDGDTFESCPGGTRSLYAVVHERHAYTTVMRFTHIFKGLHERALSPDAYVRLYHDAQLAELSHCAPGIINAKSFPAARVPDMPHTLRWKMQMFLQKWVDHVRDSGHNTRSFHPVKLPPSLAGG